MDTHEMKLVRHIGNIQDWQCTNPECGRYVVVTLHPFHREVIQPGDTTALHSGMDVEAIIKQKGNENENYTG